jgi:cardiolipin synthase A/B
MMHSYAVQPASRPARSEPPPRPSQADALAVQPVATSHHAVTLYPDMEPMLRQVAADIGAARRRAWIETYIYRHDRLGRAFGASLARAVQRGVDARLLYDPLGCNETDPEIFAWMAARGVQVRAYRPGPVQRRDLRWWPRDHSRILVVDDAGYTGGAAWGDEWLPRRYGGRGWHDVCTRVEGACVEDFAAAFAQRWAEAAGEAPRPRGYTTGGKYSDLELVADAPFGRSEVMSRYRARVRAAHARVWIENAYFLAPGGLLRDLYDAAARGVDVRLILPGETDLPVLKRAARARYPAWLAHGLKVHEYGRSVVHAKFAVIDDDWATVGTFNANAISLRYANEVNLFVYDRSYVAEAARLFERDLLRSNAVTARALEGHPWYERLHDLLADQFFAMLELGRGGA